VKPDAEHKAIVESLRRADDSLVLLGNVAGRHGAAGAVRALAVTIAALTDSNVGSLSEGANSAGAHLAGLLPHRAQGGKDRLAPGLNAANMLDATLDAVVLVNIEPDVDIRACDNAVDKLSKQGFVIALTPFVSDAILAAADLLLPIGTFAETSGTYVNIAGTWQSFGGVASPVGESRPAWKVLRVLGNLLDVPDFDYVTSEDVRDDIVRQLGEFQVEIESDKEQVFPRPNGEDALSAEIDIPLYSADSLVRRATALQLTATARRAARGNKS
jgi:NADH-quinone oxidoreductase subunit G